MTFSRAILGLAEGGASGDTLHQCSQLQLGGSNLDSKRFFDQSLPLSISGRAKGESESACPRRAETYFTFSPSEIRRLAAVWRRSWKRGFGSASFASLTAFPSRPEGPQDRVAAAFLSFA